MLLEEPAIIKKGIYRHYKGNLYEVIGMVRHSETSEELVLYKALYETRFGKDSLWVRPAYMFTENIFYQGAEMPRFRYIEDSQN